MSGQRSCPFRGRENLTPGSPIEELAVDSDFADVGRRERVVERNLCTDQVEDGLAPGSFPEKSAAIFLACAAGEHEIAAIFRIIPPPPDQLLIDKLCRRNNQK